VAITSATTKGASRTQARQKVQAAIRAAMLPVGKSTHEPASHRRETRRMSNTKDARGHDNSPLSTKVTVGARVQQ
jgi:hypothetical protein